MHAFLARGKHIPGGVRLITWATSIRYVAWGLVEALMPIFLFSFTGKFSEAGLVSSVYDIMFILSLPFAGMLADRTASKKIMLAGLWLYPFISVSYFLAGVTSLVGFIVLARAINGVAYAFDSSGRKTYFRRFSSDNNASTIFGYFETVSTFWWIAAMLASIWLSKFLPVHVLFLVIIPTVCMTMFLVAHLKSEKAEPFRESLHKILSPHYDLKVLKHIGKWDVGLRVIGLVVFFLSMVAAIVQFIFPIYLYNAGAGLTTAILVNVMFNIPLLFGLPFAEIVDKRREAGIGVAFLTIILCLLIFLTTDSKIVQMIMFFVVGVAFQIGTLSCDGITTVIAKSREYGIVSSAMSAIADLGNIIGMIGLGYLVDKRGMSFSIFTVVFILFAVSLVILRFRKHLRHAMPVRFERATN